MDLSLVVTTFNRAHLLKRTLGSIAALERPSDFKAEVLVVDNNSRDATAATLAAIAARWSGLPLRLCLESRQGLSHARNRGAAEARGQWVAYMDDDQMIAPDYLVEFRRALRGPQAEIIGGRIEYRHEAPLPDWLPPLIRTVGQLDLGAAPRLLDPATDLLKGGNFGIRRDTLESAGGFDPGLGRVGSILLAGEEDELQRRVSAAGGKLLYWPGLMQFNVLEPGKLHKRYWRRHAFGWGCTQVMARPPMQRLAAWQVRATAQALLAWLRTSGRRRFEAELEVWEAAGAMVQALRDPRRRLGQMP